MAGRIPDVDPNLVQMGACATVLDLVAEQARRSPEAAALLGSGRGPLTYSRLHAHLLDTARKLRSLGIGRGDRVAIVLPDGPEMATAFLSVACCATAGPLNPAYAAEEFDFYLGDLSAKALIVESGAKSAAAGAAVRRGVPVIELSPVFEECAGIFTLNARAARPAASGEWCGPEDIALVLHTSGTTSRPKRVPLTHRSLCASAANVSSALRLIETDRCLNVMPLFHIHGIVAGLLASLGAGGSVVCALGFIAPRFFEWLAEFHPTWYTAVPTMHQSILAQSAAHVATLADCPLRFIRSSSAALAPKLSADLEAFFHAPVIQAYGMTEASHQIASNPLPPATRKPGSVGLAAGPEVAIMDEAGRLLARGQTGEIVLRGENLTRGYENNLSANESAFTHGWFRTGDLGYLDPEGYLFITGRLKELINRGGEKISPREVDEALLGHPAIAQAVTFAMPDARLGEDVAAAVVLKPNAEASEREIRDFAAARLAPFKVPRRVLIVQDVPKGPTGKIQRVGLAGRLGLKGEPDESRGRKAEYVAPRTPLERELAQLWAGILRLDRVGIHDVFLHLGGDSILAAQLVSRIRDKFAVELSLISLFDEAATVAGMAQQIEKAPRLAAGPAIPPLRRNDSERAIPLSYSQQSWWLFHEYEPDASLCNALFAYRLRGPVDVPALERSLHEVVRRHALLRTVYRAENGRTLQHPVLALAVPLTRSDVAGGSIAEALRLHHEDARLRFDLVQDSPIRAKLLRLAPDDYVLALTLHRIAFDAWSEVILRRELAALYSAYSRGAPSLMPSLPFQYADFVLWQQDLEAGPLFARHLAYWKGRLMGAPPSCDLGRGHARKRARTFSIAHRSLDLPGGLLRRLEELSRREGVSLFVTLLATFKVLLHRHTMQTDIVVGTPIAGRNRTEFEGIIGCFANLLALRTDLSGDVTFHELLRRVQRTVLGALEHQDAPFEKVVEAVRPAREQNRLPLVQIVFEFLNLPVEQAADGPLRLERLEIEPEAALFDAQLCVQPKAGGLHCSMTCNTALFDAPAMDRMLGHFRTLLEALAEDGAARRISELPLLTPEERRQILVDWNRTATEFPKDRCLHQLFEEQVERTPEAVALVHEKRELSYGELNTRANQLAHYLRDVGVKPDARVAICVERGIEMVVSLLAVLKAGGAYVPLDPAYPVERLSYMLEDSAPTVLLTQGPLNGLFAGRSKSLPVIDLATDSPKWANQPASNPDPAGAGLTPEHMAYVIYTSGSTGKPKGIAIEHRNVVNFICWGRSAVAGDILERTLFSSSLSFDLAVYECFVPITVGATVRIVRDALALVGAATDVTLINTVPTVMTALVEAGGVPKTVRRVNLAGEPLKSTLVDRIFDTTEVATVCNLYGPSETTTYSTWVAMRRGEGFAPQIGCPIANTQIYILDGQGQPVPIGVAGEIHIGGAGVARGYLNRPELTAERFLRDPFAPEAGARMYKTGDLGRWLPDGAIEFLGRNDFQVKVRGYRIELGEIEAQLKEHAGVSEAAVLAREDSPGDQRLVAYYLAAATGEPGEGAVNAEELKRHLARRLPEYMVPSAFVRLETMPRTPNGKLDRRALPAPEVFHRPPLDAAYRAPRSPIEEILAAIWATVLRVSPIGAEDNFFELGGHSLLAAGIISRVGGECGVTLTLREFFEAPTVAAMSLMIANRMAERYAPDDVARMLDRLAAES